MTDHPRSRGAAALGAHIGPTAVSLIVLFAALGIAGALAFTSPTPPLPKLAPQQLSLVINVIPSSEHAYFSPGNFTVSSASVVTVTLVNFDPDAAPVSAYAAQVLGVVGSSETVTFAPGAHPVQVQSLGVNDVSHTFSINDGKYYNVNIPIPPAESAVAPSTVQFTMFLYEPGTYTWWCAAPCEYMPMGPGGGMSGTITVTS